MGVPPGAWASLYFGALDGFDEAALRCALEAAWPGDFPGLDDEDPDHEHPWRDSTFRLLSQAVEKCCGSWANYWTFGQSACSYGYWYVRPPYGTMQLSVELMVTDVKRWQKLLLDLEDEFALLRSRCSSFELAEHLEFAIASLLRHCPSLATNVQWHVGFEMWYRPFAQLVSWYLSSTGLPETHVNLLGEVTNAIHGFRSYRCPPATAAVVVKQVAPKFKSCFVEVDSTADWLQSRASLAKGTAVSPTEVEDSTKCEDSHSSFIENVDFGRDPKRAADLRYALNLCRKDAQSAVPLEFELLMAWQKYLIHPQHGNPCFRTLDAYAKHGRERYPINGTTESKFKELLAEANSHEPLAFRAVRAYMDVLFFHPFDDCNSRMARLVFDFLLTREGYSLRNVEPVFMFSKSAKDAEGAKTLVDLVQQQLVKLKEDWNQPLTKWIEQHPHPGFENYFFRWFSCMRFPEDNRAEKANPRGYRG
eukprot:Skav203060  [mRNA]  locus=scaffold4669:69942:71372:- [translate_table: standard]